VFYRRIKYRYDLDGYEINYEGARVHYKKAKAIEVYMFTSLFRIQLYIISIRINGTYMYDK